MNRGNFGHGVGAWAIVAIGLFGALATPGDPVPGGQKSSPAGDWVKKKSWAILIGVEKYQIARNPTI